MRLSPDEIHYIARKVVKVLTEDHRIEVDDRQRVVDGIVHVVAEELQVEDRLNEEVREVLIQHTRQMERSDITYSEMFKKVKRELAKQKGIIL
jgi:hypothetical protein